jgi:hypothetical protein
MNDAPIRAPRFRARAPLAWILAAALAPAAAALEARDEIGRWLEQLSDADFITRHRAEIELRQAGTEALLPLAEVLLGAADLGRRLQVEPIFQESLKAFLDELEREALAVAEEKADIRRLEDLAAKSGKLDDEDEERLKNFRGRLAAREPRLQELNALFEKVAPAALGEILKRQEFLPAELAHGYQAVFDAQVRRLGRDGLLGTAGGEELRDRRYLMAPLWYWLLAYQRSAQPAELSAEVEKRLGAHLEASFADLSAPDYRLRERAEDGFYVLRERGIEFLRGKRSAHPAAVDRLLHLLDWRIHPRLVEKTSLDFRNYRELGFRERRQHVIRYARTAGRDAIPTLRLVVLDDAREPSVRIKLTAAEQLAGLRDSSGILILTQKPMPELLKIPEISRDFFILKGIQYQDEKKYDLAAREFQKILDESPFHFEANYRLAFVLLLDKQHKRSIQHFEIALKARPGDMLSLYNLACACSLDGQLDRAAQALEDSVKAGFDDLKHIQEDPDLTPLRAHPHYLRIVDGLKGATRSGAPAKKRPDDRD